MRLISPVPPTSATPSTTINALKEYLNERNAFIEEDRSLRRDYRIAQSRPPLEAQADRIVRKIRKEEEKSIWREKHETIPHPFPGMEFLTGKAIITKTRIFDILSKMPKGALLHAHLDATVNAAVLLELALREPVIFVRTSEPVTRDNIGTVLPIFQALPERARPLINTSLTDSNYQVDSWVNIREARETFDSALGGPKGFDKWVVDSMMINPSEAYGTHNTIFKIWQKFESTFEVSNGLINYAPIFKQYTKLFFLNAIEDGISYVEPRINFFFKHINGLHGEDNITHRDMVIMFQDVIDEVKEEQKQKGCENKFCGAKIIYSTLKCVSSEELNWYLEDCINLKKEFPDTIIGFDLVGDENELHTLKDYLEPLLRFRERQKEEGVEIPFIFHAGETLGDGDTTDDNLYDAILLGTKRIGHGFSIVKHPKIMDVCRERNIAIEVCPISNEILRLTSSMPMHPLPIMLNNGVPVALCSDDPAVFGNMGLTYDFFQVLVSSEQTGLGTLGVMARDSIEYSSMTAEEKGEALAAWEAEWQRYLEYIVGLE